MILSDALKAVAPHLAPAKSLTSVLTGVLIRDGYAWATDRFTVARARIDSGLTVPEGVEVWLSPEDVKAGVASITHSERAGFDLTLVNGGVKTVTGVSDDGSTYPAVENLFSRFVPAEEGHAPNIVRFNPELLARFAASHFPGGKRIHGSQSMVLEFQSDPHKSVRVTRGGIKADEFAALVMPMKEVN